MHLLHVERLPGTLELIDGLGDAPLQHRPAENAVAANGYSAYSAYSACSVYSRGRAETAAAARHRETMHRPSADVGGVSPVLAQMWQAVASARTCPLRDFDGRARSSATSHNRQHATGNCITHGPCSGGPRAKAGLLRIEWGMKRLPKTNATHHVRRTT